PIGRGGVLVGNHDGVRHATPIVRLAKVRLQLHRSSPPSVLAGADPAPRNPERAPDSGSPSGCPVPHHHTTTVSDRPHSTTSVNRRPHSGHATCRCPSQEPSSRQVYHHHSAPAASRRRKASISPSHTAQWPSSPLDPPVAPVVPLLCG